MGMDMSSTSLFEIDAELDLLLEQIQEQTEEGIAVEDSLLVRFHAFCQAHGEKVDRIGRFVRTMEARESFCRAEAARLLERARAASGKVERTKSMTMFFLLSRQLKKVEGREFTLRVQKNSQDSLKVTDEANLPLAYRKVVLNLSGVLYEMVLSHLPAELAAMVHASVSEFQPDNEAIRCSLLRNEAVPGAELRRGSHLRVA